MKYINMSSKAHRYHVPPGTVRNDSMDAYFTLKNFKNLLDNLSLHLDFKITFAIFAFAFEWIFGADKQYLLVVTALIVIDTFTGMGVACKRGLLSSYGFYRFSAKCLMYFLLAATGALIDKVLPIPVASSILFSFLAITEAISIFENVATLGFPVPKKLFKYMKVYNESLGDKLGQNTDEVSK